MLNLKRGNDARRINGPGQVVYPKDRSILVGKFTIGKYIIKVRVQLQSNANIVGREFPVVLSADGQAKIVKTIVSRGILVLVDATFCKNSKDFEVSCINSLV